MLSLPKLAVIGVVVIAGGALQFAVPAFTANEGVSIVPAKTETQAMEVIHKNLPVKDFQDAQSGAFYIVNDSLDESKGRARHLLSPTLTTEVDIKVTGIVARTKLTQTFKNASDKWVNGLYVFPLPENAAVDHLLMKVGERQIEGQIKPKAEAKKIFEQAKSEGKKASLVAQQRPNMFSNSISNIGPNEIVEVSIEYQQVLTYDNESYNLRFPMTITPRYSPNNHIEGEDLIHPPNVEQSHHSQDIKLQVSLQSGFELVEINSEFHAVQRKQLSDGSHFIRLAEGKVANQDFVLTWKPELGSTPETAHFSQWVNGKQYGLIMFLPPKLQDNAEPFYEREVIFVLDTSGSMQGDSLEQAKQALAMAISELNKVDTFNLIEFNSYAQNLWKAPKVADSANKEEAIVFVNSLSANGGTEMKSALNLALSHNSEKDEQSHGKARLRQVVFMTDGSVGNEESLMQLISNKLADSRLFTVGIGSAPNSYFMSEAAKMGKGTFTYIGSVNQVQEKMQALLTKLTHPALTDIELQLNTEHSLSVGELEFYPNIINDLYAGEPLVVSYQLNAQQDDNDYLSKLKVKARYRMQPWEEALNLGANTRQSGLNVLWARQKIAQLTRDKRRASMLRRDSEASSQVIQQEYKTRITNTALDHHLVSQYTSLVAVDVTPSKPIELNSQNMQFANSIPKGSVVNATGRTGKFLGKLPQTATLAQLKIMSGLILIGLFICMHLLTKSRIYS